MILVIAALAISVVLVKAAVTDNESVPFSFSQFVPCANGGAGEVVDLSGDLHVLTTLTINGNNVSAVSHFQPQGISGTGGTTGAKYQATGITTESFKGSLQNGQLSDTFVNNFRIIGQGPGNNLLVHEVGHITFSADGTVRVDFDNPTVDCR